MLQKMKMQSVLHKKIVGIHYIICLTVVGIVAAVKWYFPGAADQYAEKVCGIIEGDADFAAAAEIIQAWANGDVATDTAVQAAAKFAFGIGTSQATGNKFDRFE